ncbi:MAG: chaperonin GroEL [Candidatus Gracilibacteria bacterium]|nr:chaperonin GroEL [Candidatus Gracilibacteria bacterium]MDQ7022496.1 chaperonin GroEL [Candidatus Gracilibacteria bacterium]
MKNIINGEKSRKKIFSGIKKVAKTVICTMGPKGRNVILDKGNESPLITNDGVTIAREITLEDKFENMGAGMVKQAAEKTNTLAGDGTTTATLLTYAIAKEGQKYLKQGVNAVELKNGLLKARDLICEELEKNTKQIKSSQEIEQVATISAQDSEVGGIIADAMEKVGNTGVISIEEGQTFGLEVSITQGMEFDQGYISPYMISDSEKMLSIMDNSPILITDQKISQTAQLLPILEKLVSEGIKDLVILAEDVENDALTAIVLNKIKGSLNILAIKNPGFGEGKNDFIKDIAILTGTNIITSELGMKLENIELSDLGKAKTIISSKNRTTIIGGLGDKKEIEERIEELKQAIDIIDDGINKDLFLERLAKLDSGVALIKVGAASEIEMKEKKLRIEDALNSTRAAIEEGVVAGGGIALLKASQILEGISFGNSDQDLAIKILKKALIYPTKQILKNAGKDYKNILSQIIENSNINFGYNAATDNFEDMIQSGIIDPKKVERIALEQAISLSAMFLTTEAAISIPKRQTFKLPDVSGMNF